MRTSPPSRSATRPIAAGAIAALTATLLVSAPAMPASANPADPNLLLSYSFDDGAAATVVDDSGNGNDGAVVGTPAGGTGTMAFTGSNHVRMPDGLLAGKDAATITTEVMAADLSGAQFLWNMGGTGSGDSGTGQFFIQPVAPRVAIATKNWSNEQSAPSATTKLQLNTWHSVTATIAKNDGGATSTLRLYIDGTKVAEKTDSTTHLSDLTDHTNNLIGKSAYSADKLFRGSISEFRVYDRALDDTEIRAASTADAATVVSETLNGIDLQAANAQSLDAVRSALTLPTEGGITWSADPEGVIAADGTVTRPEDDTPVTLTARVSARGSQDTRSFPVVVLGANAQQKAQEDVDAITIPNADDIRTNITLAQSGAIFGSQLEWSAAPSQIILTEAEGAAAPGVVKRPGADTVVTLTVKATNGAATAERQIPVTVRAGYDMPKTEAYLLGHFTGLEGKPTDEQIYFATSLDAKTWTDTRPDGAPVLSVERGLQGIAEGGVRDPYIVRSPEGDKFYMLATDLSIHYRGGWGSQPHASINGSTHLVMWESTDLVEWSEPWLVDVAGSIDGAGMAWAPEAFWDEDEGQYYVFWATRETGESQHTQIGDPHNMYIATTRDFRTFSEPQLWIDREHSIIDTTMIKVDGWYYRASGDGQITIEKSRKISTPTISAQPLTEGTDDQWTLVGTLQSILGGTNASCSTQTNYTGGCLEGPEFMAYNEADQGDDGFLYTLAADLYGAGAGYLPFKTKDPGSADPADWAKDTTMDLGGLKKRHGTFLPITLDEYHAIEKEIAGRDHDRVPGQLLNYTFDEDGSEGALAADATITDQKGNADGTVKNGGASLVRGLSGEAGDLAISLPGGARNTASPHVQIAPGLLDAGTRNVTMSGWINWSGAPDCTWPFTLGSAQAKHLLFTTKCGGNAYGAVQDGGETQARRAGGIDAGQWVHVAVVLEGGTSVSLYIDGELAQTTQTTRPGTAAVGTAEFSGYLGRSFYGGDAFWEGAIDDFRVFDTALSADEVLETAVTPRGGAQVLTEREADALRLPAEAYADLTLPTTTRLTRVSWASDDEATISVDGAVTRGDVDRDVTLTATLTGPKGAKVTRTFEVRVPALTDDELLAALVIPNRITGDLVSQIHGEQVVWSGAPESVASDGAVERPSAEAGPTEVTLTATVRGQSITATATILPVGGDALTYVSTGGNVFLGEDLLAPPDSRRSDAMRVALRADGADGWTALNRGQALVYVKWNGDQKSTSGKDWQVGSPTLFRAEDGSLGAVSSANDNREGIYVWDTRDDGVSFANERYLNIAANGTKVTQPSVVFDAASDSYKVFWTDGDGVGWVTTMASLDKGTVPDSTFPAAQPGGPVTEGLPRQATEARSFALSDAEYAALMTKYADLENTGSTGPSVSVDSVEQVTSVLEGATATLSYSDGTSKDLPVDWDQAAIQAAVDRGAADEVIDVPGTIRQSAFDYPFIEERADPFIFFNEDDQHYYATGSYYPDNPDNGLFTHGTSYRGFGIRRAATLEGLKDAPEHMLRSHEVGDQWGGFFWAPEFHKINGTWYVIVGARNYGSGGITAGAGGSWCSNTILIPFKGTEQDIKDGKFTDRAYWGTDADTLILEGAPAFDVSYYYDEDADQGYWTLPKGDGQGKYLSIAKVAFNGTRPVIDAASERIIHRIQWPFEYGVQDGSITAGNPEGTDQGIVEGPSIYAHGDKLYLFYSGATVDKYYNLSVMVADRGADITDPASWTHPGYPLLTSYDTAEGGIGGAAHAGGGHNSVVQDGNGNLVLVYHARPHPDPHEGQAGSGGLFDPDRHTAVKSINVRADGTLDLAITKDQEVAPAHRSVTAKVTIGTVAPVNPIVRVEVDQANSGQWLGSRPFDSASLTVTAVREDDSSEVLVEGVHYTVTAPEIDGLGRKSGSITFIPGAVDLSGVTEVPSVFTVQVAAELKPVAGRDRYQTSLKVLQEQLEDGMDVYVVSGRDANMADALVATPVAVQRGGVVAVVDPDGVDDAMIRLLQDRRPASLTVIGGRQAVPESVREQLADEIGMRVDRVAGPDRYATAAAMAKIYFVDGADGVLIASGETVVDALAGSVVAGQQGWPVLFATANDRHLPAATAEAVTDMDPADAIVAGGRQAVHTGVDADLRGRGIAVKREAGETRFETAALLAAQVEEPTAFASTGVALANGDAIVDVLSYAHVAADKGWPVLLSERTCLPSASHGALTERDRATRVIIGGSVVLDPALAKDLTRCP